MLSMHFTTELCPVLLYDFEMSPDVNRVCPGGEWHVFCNNNNLMCPTPIYENVTSYLSGPTCEVLFSATRLQTATRKGYKLATSLTDTNSSGPDRLRVHSVCHGATLVMFRMWKPCPPAVPPPRIQNMPCLCRSDVKSPLQTTFGSELCLRFHSAFLHFNPHTQPGFNTGPQQDYATLTL